MNYLSQVSRLSQTVHFCTVRDPFDSQLFFRRQSSKPQVNCPPFTWYMHYDLQVSVLGPYLFFLPFSHEKSDFLSQVCVIISPPPPMQMESVNIN